MNKYGISIENVVPHENASYKTPGEGGTVLEAISQRLGDLLFGSSPTPMDSSIEGLNR